MPPFPIPPDFPQTFEQLLPPEISRLPDKPLLHIASGLASEVQQMGLVILPGILSQAPGSRNDLAYRFRFLEADFFVSATEGDIIFAIPNMMTADRLVYDARGGNEMAPLALVQRNGQNLSAAPLNADAAAADPFLIHVLSFYSGLGRTSWNNKDADVAVVTNAAISLIATCPNAMWDAFRGWALFCLRMATDDVVVHEITHGVTNKSAGLLPLDEPGALNEHYSDVMAVLAFPDAPPAWVIGEATAIGTIRDLANPPATGDPAHYNDYRPRGPGCMGPRPAYKPRVRCRQRARECGDWQSSGSPSMRRSSGQRARRHRPAPTRALVHGHAYEATASLGHISFGAAEYLGDGMRSRGSRNHGA